MLFTYRESSFLKRPTKESNDCEVKIFLNLISRLEQKKDDFELNLVINREIQKLKDKFKKLNQVNDRLKWFEKVS